MFVVVFVGFFYFSLTGLSVFFVEVSGVSQRGGFLFLAECDVFCHLFYHPTPVTLRDEGSAFAFACDLVKFQSFLRSDKAPYNFTLLAPV